MLKMIRRSLVRAVLFSLWVGSCQWLSSKDNQYYFPRGQY